MENPLVSAIVLSHNRKEETLACLEAIYRQDYEPIEVVVLDNGSTDGSAEAIEQAFSSVALLRMPKNYGDWEGRDIALKNCKGKYVIIIDNDAVMEADVIRKMVGRMEQEAEVAIVEANVTDPTTGAPFSCSPELTAVTHYRANFIGCAAMVRASVLREAEGFPHYLLGGAEAHLTLRVLDMGYRICHLGDCRVYHTQSPKERIPHRRFFLSSKQRLRAYMAHYPGMFRPLGDLLWKLVHYTVEGSRRGYALKVPRDVFLLLVAGISAWRKGTWRVSDRTLNLIDYLTAYAVTTEEEYQAIPLEKSHFKERLRFRFWGEERAKKAVRVV